MTQLIETIRYYLWDTKQFYANPFILLIIASVFILERVIPAKRDQKTLSLGVAQDFIWFNALQGFQLLFLPFYINFLRSLYEAHLGFLTVQAVAEWPTIWRAVMSIIVFDFLQWFHHLIRHKVSVFWKFHMIHHSQREMNLFTDGRVHMAESFIANALIFVPLFMFQINHTMILWVALLGKWYQRVYHANLRTNYGVLKHVMVTPQSHRIHHSVERRHADKNFGVLFSVWDRMFGTLYANYEEYPETGVDDARFPVEQDVKGLVAFGKNFVSQFLFPFRAIFEKKPQAVTA